MYQKNKTAETSIIIRVKNEANWLKHSLESIFLQNYKNFEVIIVDNFSSDESISVAKNFNVKKILKIKSYKPGKALNLGINNSRGKYIVCLSAHCIPKNYKWLNNLIKNLKKNEIAGVYGRQEPLSFTPDSDKREMDIVFGLDKIIQTKGSFFHNANSAIKRSIWNKVKFNEKISNIEDRLWAQQIIDLGYKIIYEPKASVFHYHGIHQDGNSSRLKQVVNILEQEDIITPKPLIRKKRLSCVAIIPFMGRLNKFDSLNPVEITINQLKKNKFINKIIITTDTENNIKFAKKLSADFVIKRPKKLSKKFITIEEIINYTLNEIHALHNLKPDLVIYSSVNNLFRERDLFKNIYNKIKNNDYSKVIPVYEDRRSLWKMNSDQLTRIDEGTIPSEFKEGFLIGISGLATIYKVEDLKYQNFERNVGTVKCNNQSCIIDAKTKDGHDITNSFLLEWLKKN